MTPIFRLWRAVFLIAFLSSVVAALSAVALADQKDPVDITSENLHSLGRASLMYASSNHGQVPATFSALLKFGAAPTDFLDARTTDTHNVPADFATLPPDQQAQWVDQHCSFYFSLPPGMKLSHVDHASDRPLIITRDVVGTLITCFADGHVEVYKATGRVIR